MLSAYKDVLPRLRGITDAETCLLVIAVAIGVAVMLATAAEPAHAGSSSPPEVWNPEPATYGIVNYPGGFRESPRDYGECNAAC